MKNCTFKLTIENVDQVRDMVSRELQDTETGSIKIELNGVEEYDSLILHSFEREYNIEVILHASSSNIRTVDSEMKDISCSLYQDKGQLEKDAKFTNKIGFNEVWKDYLPPKYLVDSERILLDLISPPLSLRIGYKERLVGMLCLFSGENVNGLQSEIVGWIWADSQIQREIRKQVHLGFSNWLRSRGSEIKLAVYHRNLRSLQFHKGLGFKPISVKYSRFSP